MRFSGMVARGRIVRCGSVPVKLHKDTTGPLDDGVAADGIFEGFDDDVSAAGAGGAARWGCVLNLDIPKGTGEAEVLVECRDLAALGEADG